MTKSEALAGHRRLWNTISWLIRNGEFHKNVKWYKKEGLELICESRILLCDCYCCEYDYQYANDGSAECSHCPVIWGNCEEYVCDNSEYKKFGAALLAENYDEAAKIAEEIANLPEREGEWND